MPSVISKETSMKKKNSYRETNVSFEDFEQAMLSQSSNSLPFDELVKERLSMEKEARKNESTLKKAYRTGNRK
jgi:hypothetical protein